MRRLKAQFRTNQAQWSWEEGTQRQKSIALPAIHWQSPESNEDIEKLVFLTNYALKPAAHHALLRLYMHFFNRAPRQIPEKGGELKPG